MQAQSQMLHNLAKMTLVLPCKLYETILPFLFKVNENFATYLCEPRTNRISIKTSIDHPRGTNFHLLMIFNLNKRIP